jgi:hypothetical protein
LKGEGSGVYWQAASKRALLFGVMGLCIPKAVTLGGSRAFFYPLNERMAVAPQNGAFSKPCQEGSETFFRTTLGCNYS